MTRRFLTSEDVRRAGSGELVVEASTVVTPQALEAARGVGLTIRTASGPWQEPAPDRGPDAEREMRHPPHLPEPSDDPATATSVVVTAVGKNRPGVLAEVTSALGAAGASVHDISQRVIEGYFHLIMVVEVPSDGGFGELKQRLECLGGPEDYAVSVMHERVFRFMHRV
jgi:ACT domain-containing protein